MMRRFRRKLNGDYPRCEMPASSSDRQAIEEVVEKLFHLPRPKLRHCILQRTRAVQFRMRPCQPFVCLFFVIPDILGGGNDSGQSLGSLALRRRQSVSPFIGCFGNDPIDEGVYLLGNIVKALNRRSQRLLRQALETTLASSPTELTWVPNTIVPPITSAINDAGTI